MQHHHQATDSVVSGTISQNPTAGTANFRKDPSRSGRVCHAAHQVLHCSVSRQSTTRSWRQPIVFRGGTSLPRVYWSY